MSKLSSELREYEALPDEEARSRAWAARRTLGTRAVVLVHFYQSDEVMEFADFRGDSLELSRIAANQNDAEFIVFCGVDFMAESAAILGSEKQTVVMPAGEAPCPMAAMVSVPEMQQAWEYLENLWQRGQTVPVVYQNTGAAVKAFCGAHGGAVATSANAGAVISWALAGGKRVLFIPDQHLGTNSLLKLGYPIDKIGLWDRKKATLKCAGDPAHLVGAVWDGFCHVHAMMTVADVEKVRQEYPGIQILVHPECSREVVAASDGAGSTSFLVRAVQNAPSGAKFAIGTEWHMVQRLAKENPDKVVVPLRRALCGTMARTNIYNLCYTLEHLVAGDPVNVITVTPEIASNARIALQRMLEIK